MFFLLLIHAEPAVGQYGSVKEPIRNMKKTVKSKLEESSAIKSRNQERSLREEAIARQSQPQYFYASGPNSNSSWGQYDKAMIKNAGTGRNFEAMSKV